MPARFRRGAAPAGGSPTPPLRSFHGIALTLLVPALALLGYFGYRFFEDASPPPQKPPTSEAAVGKSEPSKSLSPTPSKEKRIVLILDDVGYDLSAIDAATKLDSSITFAVLPNAPHSTALAKRLSARGFEVLCHLPMEPEGYPGVSPGERAILTSMTDAEIRAATLDSLRRVPNFRGMNNHMGSRATEDARVMREVLSVLRREGGYFIDSRTTAGSVGETLARAMKIRSASRDVFLDPEPNEAAIRRQLRSLAESAERSGIAVGIGHLYPQTIAVLREEVPRLKAKGFRIVKASEAVR